MLLIKIYIFFFILDALLIMLYIARGRRREASPPSPLQKERGEDRAKEGEEILNQIFNTKQKT